MDNDDQQVNSRNRSRNDTSKTNPLTELYHSIDFTDTKSPMLNKQIDNKRFQKL